MLYVAERGTPTVTPLLPREFMSLDGRGGIRMKTGCAAPSPCRGRFWLAALLLACLLLIPLLSGCAGEEEATHSGDGMGVPTTPTATASPTAAVTGTPTATGKVPGITDTEIILGADVPLAGAMGAVYATIPQATKAYFDYINDTQGGVCGRQIVYKLEDNGMDPAKAAEAARKLVERDKVFAITGSLGDIPHGGVWDYLNEQGVPDFLLSAGAHMFVADPEGHPWTIQMIPDYRNEATFFGQYISENLPGKKVGVLYENQVFGYDGLAGVKMSLDPDKNELVSEQSYESTAVSVRSQIANLKNDGAEVVVLYTTPGYTAQAVKEADNLGWYPQWITSYVNSDEMLFSFVSPQLLEGAITSQIYKLAVWTDDPAIAQHYQIMRDYGGPTPTNFTVYGQSLGEVAVEILSRTCDNLTREGLMEATESLTSYHSDLLLKGVNISFGPNDHTALGNARLLKVVLHDGKGQWEYFGPILTYEGEE
jgi:ABC-type branched-subunit amino acid transport system substrate-binding protein